MEMELVCVTCEFHAHDTFLVKVSWGVGGGGRFFDLPNRLFGFHYIDETASPSNYNCWFLSGVPLGSGWMHIPPFQAKEIDPQIQKLEKCA